jgi:hypothetical protein
MTIFSGNIQVNTAVAKFILARSGATRERSEPAGVK